MPVPDPAPFRVLLVVHSTPDGQEATIDCALRCAGDEHAGTADAGHGNAWDLEPDHAACLAALATRGLRAHRLN